LGETTQGKSRLGISLIPFDSFWFLLIPVDSFWFLLVPVDSNQRDSQSWGKFKKPLNPDVTRNCIIKNTFEIHKTKLKRRELQNQNFQKKNWKFIMSLQKLCLTISFWILKISRLIYGFADYLIETSIGWRKIKNLKIKL
jgi:hypothetical protein